MTVRKDVLKIEIQENAYMLVYHKNLDIGFGPALGLYLYDIEYLKFDFFGVEQGHYHIFNKKRDVRIYFKERTVLEQINKVAHELTNNIQTYLEGSKNKKILEFQFETDVFRSKILAAVEILSDYENKNYSFLRA